MIAVDTNILVYAHRAESPWHAGAVSCVKNLAEGKVAWALPWPCIHEFLSIVTHPKIWDPPTPLPEALLQVEAWLQAPKVVLLAEQPAYWGSFRELLEKSRVVGPKIHDARIAALCSSHGVRELWTADRDFNRFSELRVRNPLVQ